MISPSPLSPSPNPHFDGRFKTVRQKQVSYTPMSPADQDLVDQIAVSSAIVGGIGALTIGAPLGLAMPTVGGLAPWS